MATDRNIVKGSRVSAEWYIADPKQSLAGQQPKIGAILVVVTGVCVHFRANHPTVPTEIRIYLDPDGTVPQGVKLVKPHGCTHEVGHIEVRPQWITKILPTPPSPAPQDSDSEPSEP